MSGTMSADAKDAPSREVLGSGRRFVGDFARYAGRKGVAAAVFVALGSLLEVMGLAFLVPLLGVVFGGVSSAGRLQSTVEAAFRFVHVESPVGRLGLLLAVFAALMVARAVVGSRRAATLAQLQVGFVEARRLRVTQLLAAARWEQVVRLRHARIVHLMSGDIQRVGMATQYLLQATSAFIMLLAQCVLAFLLAPILAGLAFGLLVIGGLLVVPLLRKARSLGAHVTNANLALLDSTAQFLGGLKLAISQNLQSRFVAEFGATLAALSRRQVEYIRQQTNAQLALTTMSALVAGVLVFVGFAAFHIAPAVLTTLLVIVARMSTPAAQVQTGAQQIAHVLPAYEKIKEIEAELAGAASTPDLPMAPPLPEGPIRFDNVCFVHPGEEATEEGLRGVEGLTLTILPGEFVGVAGPTGAGKTTFADLLVGLLPPQTGAIRVGDMILDEAHLAQWRAVVSYVSQDPFLFHDSIRRNLSWADPAAGEEDMWRALRLAGAEARIRGMENGLDTLVGERGTLLSGGERQSVALARAILRKPRLMVLDEATSAIDVPHERAIIANLLELKPRLTIVMIAHRRESLGLCDRLLWIENGRLCQPAPEGMGPASNAQA